MDKKIKLNVRHIPTDKTIHIGKLDDTYITTTWIINRELQKTELDDIILQIINFCDIHKLEFKKIDQYHLNISGSSNKISNALSTDFSKYNNNGDIYYGINRDILLPIEWTNKIINILGLNSNKIAQPRHIGQKLDTTTRAFPRATTYFYPPHLATLYNFPTGLNGMGQKIGIIELGGGYVLADIISYLQLLNINTIPTINDISINGAINNPSDTSGANIEVVLDIEIIVSLAPGAIINVYFAPNSDLGFYNAINQAITDGCNIISISWGAPEVLWSSITKTSFNNLFQIGALQNINIFCASGDAGSSDGLFGTNVDFPASSQYVIGCGGTKVITTDNITISSEVVWNNNSSSATGGGISTYFSKPLFQNNVTYNLNGKRGVPDVSGNADPNSGYIIYSGNDGGSYVVGGTSAVSPLWSGLIALINQSTGTSSYLNTLLYNNTSALMDITSGNNGAYSANIGWDPCTGNGSPNGLNILNLFIAPASPVANFTGTPLSGNPPLNVYFTDISTNIPTSWLWNFGDSFTSTLKNPSHIYNTSGIYNVSLTSTNTNGSDIITKNNYITVNTLPIIPIANFIGTPLSGTVPLLVNFTDTSTNNPTQWAWNFGNNTTSFVQNPIQIYNSVGVYNVTLIATNSAGSHTLIINSYITVNALPTIPSISFTCTPLSGIVPLAVQFNDTSLGNPTNWLWNFGDSYTSNIQNPTHVYSNIGIYDVTLTGTNSNGTNTLTKSSYINVLTGNVPLTFFSGYPLNGNSSLTVNFVDLSINNPTSWKWAFGDGTQSSSKNPSKIYSSPGTYSVSLTTQNSYGSHITTKTNYINLSSNILPIPQFVSNTKTGKVPFAVLFNDKSSGYPNKWLWNFGDNHTSQLQNPSHVYTKKGIYSISLQVWNNSGDNTIIKTSYIKVV
jgi:PKD repeat protein